MSDIPDTQAPETRIAVLAHHLRRIAALSSLTLLAFLTAALLLDPGTPEPLEQLQPDPALDGSPRLGQIDDTIELGRGLVESLRALSEGRAPDGSTPAATPTPTHQEVPQ